MALPNALWADQVTLKNSLGVSPYTLVYGKESILRTNILLPSSQLAQVSRGSNSEVLQARINTLFKLEESISKSKERFKHQQEIVKRWFEKHLLILHIDLGTKNQSHQIIINKYS